MTTILKGLLGANERADWEFTRLLNAEHDWVPDEVLNRWSNVYFETSHEIDRLLGV